MLICLLCLVSIGLFVIYHVISAVLRGNLLVIVIACVSFAFCQMINKEIIIIIIIIYASEHKNSQADVLNVLCLPEAKY